MPHAAQQPAEAQEIQAVTLAFTQVSCDDSKATTETVPDISEDMSPHSHDTASSVCNLSSLDTVFLMLHRLFQEPWTMLYEEALHEYMEDMPCSIIGALKLVTTWHQIHEELLAEICTMEQAEGNHLQMSNPRVLASLYHTCPTLHLCIILNCFLQTFNLALGPAADTVAAWRLAHPIVWSDSHPQGTPPHGSYPKPNPLT